MIDPEEIVKLLKEKIRTKEFKIPSSAELKMLLSLHLPAYHYEWMKQASPVMSVTVGDVNLHSITGLLEENRDYIPGADLYPLGFTVFASNDYGDAYCYDMNRVNEYGEYDIYFAPHDSVDYSKEDSESVYDELVFQSSQLLDFLKAQSESES